MKIVRLTQEHAFKPFDCGEEDLNDFLLEDAKQYVKGLLAVTYVIEDDDMTVDALQSAVPFYERNGFKPLRKENKGETVPMYYDLTQLV